MNQARKCCNGECNGNGHIESDRDYAKRVADDDPRLSQALKEARGDAPDTPEEIYALDESEDYTFLDPEPITGYSLLEEIRFSLYDAKAQINRLEKLLDTYQDVSRLQR